MEAFFESTTFEDAIRNAVSLGGDSDTLACIAGAVAEAKFGIPENIAKQGIELDKLIRKYSKKSVLWGCSINPEAITKEMKKYAKYRKSKLPSAGTTFNNDIQTKLF